MVLKKKFITLAIVAVGFIFVGFAVFSHADHHEGAQAWYSWGCTKGHTGLKYSNRSSALNAMAAHQRSTGHSVYERW